MGQLGDIFAQPHLLNSTLFAKQKQFSLLVTPHFFSTLSPTNAGLGGKQGEDLV